MHPEIRQIFVIGVVAMLAALVLSVAIKVNEEPYQGFPTGFVISDTDIPTIPEQFAAARDFFAVGNPALLTSPAGLNIIDYNNFDQTINVDHAGGFIYKTGYYLSGNVWHPFEFTDKSGGAIDGDWIDGDEGGKYTITDTFDNHVIEDATEELIVAIYTCKLHNEEWKCGCTNSTCTYDANPSISSANKWMIESFDLGSMSGDYINVSKNVSGKVTVGTPVRLDVDIITDPAKGAVYGYEFSVEYDPSILDIDILSTTYDGYLGADYYSARTGQNDSVSPDFLCVAENKDAVQGTVTKVACTATGTTMPNPGTTLIRTVTFNTIATGYSQIRIKNAQFARWSDPSDIASSTAVLTPVRSNNADIEVI